MLEKFHINGRSAVVTGGAGLMGRQHVEALVEIGAHVFVADVDYEAAKQVAAAYYGSATPICLDVSDVDSVNNCKSTILKTFSNIDILINNAAIDPKVAKDSILNTSRVENFKIDDWNHQINIGLTGAFLCSQVFGSIMSYNRAGIILNISSDLSVIAPDQRLYASPNFPEEQQPVKPITYSVVKTGLIGLTRYLAAYWASHNVRVNAISPGGIYNDQGDDFVQRLSNLVPLGRMANKDEYQSAVQFLCSDASSYLTGQNIVIDGGRSII